MDAGHKARAGRSSSPLSLRTPPSAYRVVGRGPLADNAGRFILVELVSEKSYEFAVPTSGLNIYRLRRPVVDEEMLLGLGERLGVHTTPDQGTLTFNETCVGFSQPHGWELRVFRRSGGWQFRHLLRWQADDGSSNLEIEDRRAVQLALELVVHTGLVQEPDIKPFPVQRLHVAHGNEALTTYDQRIVGVRVAFSRIVDGMAVLGPGGKTIVYLGSDRELTGIDHLWHGIDDVHEAVTELRPVEHALDEVRRLYGTGGGRIEIRDVQLGYFELDWDEQQNVLQPAYLVVATLESPEEPYRMNAVVPVVAAANAVEPLRPPPHMEYPPREPREPREPQVA